MLHSVLLHLTEVKPHFRLVWHDAMSLIFTLTVNKRLQRLQVVHASVMSKPIINFRRRVGQTTAGSQMLRFTFSGDGIWHRKLDWFCISVSANTNATQTPSPGGLCSVACDGTTIEHLNVKLKISTSAVWTFTDAWVKPVLLDIITEETTSKGLIGWSRYLRSR